MPVWTLQMHALGDEEFRTKQRSRSNELEAFPGVAHLDVAFRDNDVRLLEYRTRFAAVTHGRSDEAAEQRMGIVGTGLELRMELRAMKKGWLGISTTSTSRSSGDNPDRLSPASSSRLAVPIVDLPAVPVALIDERLVVERLAKRTFGELGGIDSEPHRAALVLDIHLIEQQVDDRIRRRRIEF